MDLLFLLPFTRMYHRLQSKKTNEKKMASKMKNEQILYTKEYAEPQEEERYNNQLYV